VETVRDIEISQPRQKPRADQWGIRSGSGEAREPVGRTGRARRGQEGKGQQEWREETALFRASRVLAGRSPDTHGMRWGGQEKKWRGAIGQNDKEEQRKWPGPGGALKRADCWPSGQVRTGNAVNDASYVLWERGWGASSNINFKD
jgi:hypothetical protein